MFGAVIVAAALAFMGAPASTPVACNPDTTGAIAAQGATYNIGTPAVRIDLGPVVCAGLLYLAASPTERVALRAANPLIYFPHDIGIAVIVLLHEAHHVTGDRDETSTECAAMAALPAFVAAHIEPDLQASVINEATFADGTLPDMYHTHPCS